MTASKKVVFICPECDEEDSLEEESLALVYDSVYSAQTNEDGTREIIIDNGCEGHYVKIQESRGYVCLNCGYRPPVKTPEELYIWLEKENMLVNLEGW